MRFCENEVVDVYESTGTDYAAMLRNAADEVDEHGPNSAGYFNLHTARMLDSNEYIFTLYIH